MKIQWSTLCLLVFVTSSFSIGFSTTVIFPNVNQTIEALSFMPSTLEELAMENKFVLFDENGIPYGFVDNGTFTETLKFGNLTLIPPKNQEGSIIGGYSLQTSAEDMASLRLDQGEDFDWDLLQKQDMLKYFYYSQRYEDFETFVKEGLELDSTQDGIDFLNSLTPDLANEFMSSYEALESGLSGYSHYQQLLETLTEMNNMDLTEFLDEETLRDLNEVIDNLKTDLAKDVLDNILDNIGEDELKLLYELLKELDYNQIYEIARDYARDLARDGTLDKIEKGTNLYFPINNISPTPCVWSFSPNPELRFISLSC